jgi:hypothetical protein
LLAQLMKLPLELTEAEHRTPAITRSDLERAVEGYFVQL